MVEAVRARGVPVHYLVLQNEPHGFTRQESFLKTYSLTDRFLDRHLVGDESVTVE